MNLGVADIGNYLENHPTNLPHLLGAKSTGSYRRSPHPNPTGYPRRVGIKRNSITVYHDTYNVLGPIDHFFKEIDPNAIIVYVPGCPPRPEAITWGVVKAWEFLENARRDD